MKSIFISEQGNQEVAGATIADLQVILYLAAYPPKAEFDPIVFENLIRKECSSLHNLEVQHYVNQIELIHNNVDHKLIVWDATMPRTVVDPATIIYVMPADEIGGISPQLDTYETLHCNLTQRTA